jgi:hypothetical protein
MEDVSKTISVRDAHGDELTLYEYQSFQPRLTTLGLSRDAGGKRVAVNSGEQVRRIDDGTFMVVATGEWLRKIS